MSDEAVLGIDASLTSTGLCVLPVGWGLDWKRVTVAKVGHALSKDASERERYLRIDGIALQVHAVAVRHLCKVAVLEQHAFHQGAGSHALERAELVGVIKRLLFGAGLEVVLYNASTSRKLLGKAPRKDPKVWAHQRLYGAGAPKTWNGDMLDAFLQANNHLSIIGGDALMLPAEAA